MNHDFYLISQPELVDESFDELKAVLPFCLTNSGRPAILNELLMEKDLAGGIHLQAPLEIGLQLNDMMKTITRVLLRIKSFECREFFNLEKELKKIDLSLFGKSKVVVELKVSATQSKLGQEKKIQACCELAWKNRFSFSEGGDFKIYIRIDKDIVTMSLDTSGEPLYQRGHLKLRGPAPIRETLAALMVHWMASDLTLFENKQLTWLDPMAGSGTLLSEVAGRGQKSLQREFAFEKLPSLPLALKNRKSGGFNRDHAIPYFRLVAGDLDAKSIHWIGQNLSHLERLTVFNQDFFKAQGRASYHVSEAEKLFIIVNPPYGQRIEATSEEQTFGSQQILNKVCQLHPERVGLLHLQKESQFVCPNDYELRSQHSFKNGGLSVVFSTFQSRSKTLASI
jgi:putative N6-adenine-specific DNA methylase